jgi:hypothetical protein
MPSVSNLRVIPFNRASVVDEAGAPALCCLTVVAARSDARGARGRDGRVPQSAGHITERILFAARLVIEQANFIISSASADHAREAAYAWGL